MICKKNLKKKLALLSEDRVIFTLLINPFPMNGFAKLNNIVTIDPAFKI